MLSPPWIDRWDCCTYDGPGLLQIVWCEFTLIGIVILHGGCVYKTDQKVKDVCTKTGNEPRIGTPLVKVIFLHFVPQLYSGHFQQISSNCNGAIWWTAWFFFLYHFAPVMKRTSSINGYRLQVSSRTWPAFNFQLLYKRVGSQSKVDPNLGSDLTWKLYRIYTCSNHIMLWAFGSEFHEDYIYQMYAKTWPHSTY